jgi:hypothetical protein
LALLAGTVWGTLSNTLVPVGGRNRHQMALPEVGTDPDDERLSPIADLAVGSGALWVMAPGRLLRLNPDRLQ